MIAQTVEVTRDLWQSWAVTVGGLVGAVVTLSLLVKIPGGRHAFKFLVADPVGRWMDNQMERKIETAVNLQTDAVKVAVRHHVRETLGPIEEKIDQINHAVNNVGNAPPIKDRVRKIEAQQQLDTDKLDTLTGMVESLISRK